MAEYLVFRLYGPMCSWGEIAVGESRHTADHPSRSALLGLFAAALGIERAEEKTHAELASAWRFGIKLLAPGLLLRDYHTVQAPKRQAKVRHRTRRSELLAPSVNTLLSTREYRTDSVSVIAAELVRASRWTLNGMREALQRPCFPLYLGRKSCPPALPLAPRLVQAATLREALDAGQPPLASLHRGKLLEADRVQEPWPTDEDRRWFRMEAVHYFWEGEMHLEDAATDAGRKDILQLVRHDEPLSRRRWQFAPRRERLWQAPAEPSKGGAA